LGRFGRGSFGHFNFVRQNAEGPTQTKTLDLNKMFVKCGGWEKVHGGYFGMKVFEKFE
jgi:hypothetical protein